MKKKLPPIYYTIAILFVVVVWVLAGYMYVIRFSPDRIVERCINTKNSALCYTDAVDAALKTKGLGYAMDLTAALYLKDPKFSKSCHGIMHTLGKEGYSEFSKNNDFQLTDKASYCGYGFYHGFMGELLAVTHDLAQAREFCRYVGERIPAAAGYAEGACYHGIGHGITDADNPQLWGDVDAIIDPGLSLCRAVTPSNDENERRCYSGVFNSLAILTTEPIYKIQVPTNPYDFCILSKYSLLQKEACYGEMNTVAIRVAGYNIEKALAYTEVAPNVHLRSVAIMAVIGYYVKVVPALSWGKFPKQASTVCASLGKDLIASCIQGYVGGMIEGGIPKKQHIAVLDFCSSDILTKDMQEVCFKELMQFRQISYSAEAVAMICTKTPPEYRSNTCSLQ